MMDRKFVSSLYQTFHTSGINAMSPILQDNLIIASTSHSEFYLLNPASTPYTQEQTHLPWSGTY